MCADVMTESTAAALNAFLEGRSRETLRYPELQGFLFAVAHAPEMVRPSEWIPVVFGNDQPEFKDVEEASLINTALMAEYNAVSDASREGRLPPGCVLLDDPMANLEEDAPIISWARGFVEGYRWLQDTWTAYAQMARPDGELDDDAEDDAEDDVWSEGDDLDPEEDEVEPEDDDFDPEAELGMMVSVLGFFSSRTVAERIAAETYSGDLPGVAAIMHAAFPDAVKQYAALGRILQEVDAVIERTPYQRETPKVGRNEPCPCGSGRKYKRCCGG